MLKWIKDKWQGKWKGKTQSLKNVFYLVWNHSEPQDNSCSIYCGTHIHQSSNSFLADAESHSTRFLPALTSATAASQSIQAVCTYSASPWLCLGRVLFSQGIPNFVALGSFVVSQEPTDPLLRLAGWKYRNDTVVKLFQNVYQMCSKSVYCKMKNAQGKYEYQLSHCCVNNCSSTHLM